jgi:hypothetical protein
MNNSDNYFLWREDHLVHLSVGAVIINAEGLILTVFLGRVDGKFFLPTRSHAPRNSLEEALQKISQKVGWHLEIEDFLCTTISQFPVPEDQSVTKSVIWFRCKPVSELPRDPEDRDADSEIRWKTKVELMQIFAEQAHISSDVDQRKVLELLS